MDGKKKLEELVERVARAWASIDGKAGRFEYEKHLTMSHGTGTYAGYMAEAKELLRRSGLSDAFRAMEAERDALRATMRKEALEEAAKVAETEGVYPELNVFAGGPEWYKHGKRIAAAIRALATTGQEGGR